MSTVKTKVNSEEVLDFLHKNLDSSIPSVQFMKGGEMSQAFSFISKGENLVVRIDKREWSFEKDKYAYQHFRSSKILIPKILKNGKFNEKYFFALSEQALGKNLDEWDEQTLNKLLPQIISTVDAIHKTKLPEGKFGYWNSNGKAESSSWKNFVLNKDVDTVKASDVISKAYTKIKNLVQILPEDRYLVHGDYGGNNLVSDGDSITGVLDWGESLYGDFLYDISWLEFWSKNIRFAEVFKSHYQEQKIQIPNYDQRILCYQLFIAINALGFFIKSGQGEAYKETESKMLSLPS